jgi:hypothetical protein
VGTTLDLSFLKFIAEILKILGTLFVGVKYMGGLNVMIMFADPDTTIDFLKNKKVVWSEVFKELEIWSECFQVVDRIAWIRITGVPTHLWAAENFNKIVGSFGEVIHPSDASITD